MRMLEKCRNNNSNNPLTSRCTDGGRIRRILPIFTHLKFSFFYISDERTEAENREKETGRDKKKNINIKSRNTQCTYVPMKRKSYSYKMSLFQENAVCKECIKYIFLKTQIELRKKIEQTEIARHTY